MARRGEVNIAGRVGQAIAPPDHVQVGAQQNEIKAVDIPRCGIPDVENAEGCPESFESFC
jgi:hypothetical protein